MVNPRIWNGRRISHKNPNKKNAPIARGQHIENNMQKRRKAIKNFMGFPFNRQITNKIQSIFIITSF